MAEKSIYLGNREKVEIDGQEFEVRGLKLKETLILGNILAKIITSSYALIEDDGTLNMKAIEGAIMSSTKDLEQVEGIICDIIGKDKGFLLDQDPQFFSGILASVLERTQFKVTKENFQKAAVAMGVEAKDMGLLTALRPA